MPLPVGQTTLLDSSTSRGIHTSTCLYLSLISNFYIFPHLSLSRKIHLVQPGLKATFVCQVLARFPPREPHQLPRDILAPCHSPFPLPQSGRQTNLSAPPPQGATHPWGILAIICPPSIALPQPDTAHLLASSCRV